MENRYQGCHATTVIFVAVNQRNFGYLVQYDI